MGGEDDLPEDDEASRRREEGRRREEAIRGLLKQHDDKRLSIGAVDEIALELDVSRSTMYRLITAYRAKGTVPSVEPPALGRPRDRFGVGRHAREAHHFRDSRDFSEARAPDHDISDRASRGAVREKGLAAS